MRRRISWLVLATTSVVVFSFVIPLCLLVRTLAQDRAMSAAEDEARNVAVVLARVGNQAQLAELVEDIDARGVPETSVRLANGDQLGSGPPMRGDPEVARAHKGEAFTVVDADGGRVLQPVVVVDGTAVVRTTVSEDDLRRGVAGAWAAITGLGVFLLALALALASRLGRGVSEPLLEVAGTAHRLRAGELSARADVRGTEETQELARALNGLAERTTELLATERAAVGDLSHRLRTPVTALRLDAEAVEDPELGARLQEHIAILQRTIDAIVKEARRPVRTNLAPECDATEAIRERTTFWRALADDQGRPFEVLLPDEPLTVPLARDDLADLVDVLVDNVFAHTPEGSALRVALARDDARRMVVLTVTDAGPGLEKHGLDGPGRAGRPGTTGLGLDIAGRTARDGGGAMRLGSSPTGGALVEVVLPRVTHDR